jgi:hypothetical protein
MEYTLDPTSWFSERQLKHTPGHFTISNTSLSPESKLWILNTLKGRFSIVQKDIEIDDPLLVVNYMYGYPAFEDPKEAILYELMWT